MFVAALATVAFVVGCTRVVEATHSTNVATSISFQNRTKEMVGPVDTKLDPHSVAGVNYTSIPVVNANGDHLTLDASQRPVLFVAYWCPHCQRTLQLFTKNMASLGQKPILVFVGYNKGTSLGQAVQVEHEEVRQLHLADFEVYYNLSSSASDTYAPLGYPTLVYRSGFGLLSLYGEHTLAIWEKVLR